MTPSASGAEKPTCTGVAGARRLPVACSTSPKATRCAPTDRSPLAISTTSGSFACSSEVTPSGPTTGGGPVVAVEAPEVAPDAAAPSSSSPPHAPRSTAPPVVRARPLHRKRRRGIGSIHVSCRACGRNFVHLQRPRRHGGRPDRHVAAGGAARSPRRARSEGRLQPAGPVWLLHGAGRRRASRRLRHAGPTGDRPLGHHDRRACRPRAPTWADAFLATGGSQCGFCTPGIVLRLSALPPSADDVAVQRSLLAHLCRCTGWRTILDAWHALDGPRPARDLEAASRRASLEGHNPQRVGVDVPLGRGGFADDTAPLDALVAVPDAVRADGRWARRCRKRGPARARCRAAAPPSACAIRSTCPMATGRSPCAPRGSSRPISRPMPRGARPAANQPPRWPTAAPSAARWRRLRVAAARELADRHGRAVRVLLSPRGHGAPGPEASAGRRAAVRADGVRDGCEWRARPASSTR